jgi:riboflavin kinase / FMN adenylyltransferase
MDTFHWFYQFLVCFGFIDQKEANSLEIFTSPDQLPSDLGETAVTIGKFDCLHLGHQALLSDLAEFAAEQMLSPVVLTFDKHPDQLLRPDRAKLPILGRNQKHALLEQFGTSMMLELAFTPELAAASPQQFVQNILVDALQVKLLIVGEGFRFGNQGMGDCNLLRALGEQHGFRVHELKSLEIAGEIVSTTRVRALLDEGNVSLVSSLLGRVHKVVGIVEHGLKIGREIGFPTANIARDAEGYLPLDGVYSGWLIADGISYPAAHSVGINETFQAVPRLVESHVLDETELDLYDKEVTLEFIDFVRPAAKFDGKEALVAQINLDLDVVRKQLGLE